MQLRTTSTHRTYRYVRVAIIGVVVALLVSVGVQSILGGPLGSVSAAYYTPARNVFVGALCAVALALLALSGRSIEQALVDLAAVVAPLIALVPTPVVTGSISGVTVTCPDAAPCVPASAWAEVDNGVLTFAAVGGLAVVVAVVLARVQGTGGRGLAALLFGVAILVVATVAWWALDRPSFLLGAHYAATATFFGIVCTVAVLAAARPRAGSERHARVLRGAYGAIAAGIVVFLALVVTAAVRQAAGADPSGLDGLPLFFVGEVGAIVLFAAFWVVQTVELWGQVDPSLRATRDT